MADTTAGVRNLAHAVILRAVHDLRVEEPSVRDTARAFLAGGKMLRFWATCAGLSYDAIVNTVKEQPC